MGEAKLKEQNANSLHNMYYARAAVSASPPEPANFTESCGF